MLVGYIIHGPVPGGGDTVRRCGRDGTAAGAEPGPAAPLPLRRRPPTPPPGALFVVAGVVSFEKSCKRSYRPGELGDCGDWFRFCFVFCFLSFTCTAFAVDAVTYTLLCREC